MNDNYATKAEVARDYSLARGQQTMPAPISPVPGALGNLSNANERLHERISILTQRLDAVLAPLPPAGVGEANAKMARHSLALQIEAEATSTQFAADRISGLLDRLEI